MSGGVQPLTVISGPQQSGWDHTGGSAMDSIILSMFEQAQAQSGGGAIVDLGPGTPKINTLITVPNGVSLQGAGASITGAPGPLTAAGTVLLCGAAAAGLVFDSIGGTHKGFTVHGNGVGTGGSNGCLILLGNGAQTTFVDVGAFDGAAAGWWLQLIQNARLFNCNAAYNVDNVILDGGCGGIYWAGLESYHASSHSLLIQETVGGGGYTSPSDIVIAQMLAEHNSGSNSPVVISAAAQNNNSIKLDHPVIGQGNSSDTTDPPMLISGGGNIEIDGGYFYTSAASSPSGIKLTGGSLSLKGAPMFANPLTAALDNSGGGKILPIPAPGIQLGTSVAALVSGSFIGSVQELLQTGAHVPPEAEAETTTLMVGSQGYFRRFVLDQPLTVTEIALWVITAATNNDNCDVGIFLPNGTLVASNGGVASKMNSTGLQTIPLAVQLNAYTAYYAAFAYGTVGGTAATLLTNTKSNGGVSGQLFGSSSGNPGVQEQGFRASQYPLATGLGTITTVNNVPKMALRSS